MEDNQKKIGAFRNKAVNLANALPEYQIPFMSTLERAAEILDNDEHGDSQMYYQELLAREVQWELQIEHVLLKTKKAIHRFWNTVLQLANMLMRMALEERLLAIKTIRRDLVLSYPEPDIYPTV